LLLSAFLVKDDVNGKIEELLFVAKYDTSACALHWLCGKLPSLASMLPIHIRLEREKYLRGSKARVM
jgi:hypothetical protein